MQKTQKYSDHQVERPDYGVRYGLDPSYMDS